VNLYHNKIIIYGDKTRLEEIAIAFKRPKPFQSLLPCPEFLLVTINESPSSSQMLENVRVSGFQSFFDWRAWKWGTPWGIDSADVEISRLGDGRLNLLFETTGAPAIQMIQWISANNSSCKFEMSTCWEGDGCRDVTHLLIQDMTITKLWHTKPNCLELWFEYSMNRIWRLPFYRWLIKRIQKNEAGKITEDHPEQH